MYSIFIPKTKIIFAGYGQKNYNLGISNINYSVSFLNEDIWDKIIYDSDYFYRFEKEFYSNKNIVFYLTFFSKFSSETQSNLITVGKKFLNGNTYTLPSYPGNNLNPYPSAFYYLSEVKINSLLPEQTIIIRTTATDNLISFNFPDGFIEIILIP